MQRWYVQEKEREGGEGGGGGGGRERESTHNAMDGTGMRRDQTPKVASKQSFLFARQLSDDEKQNKP